MVEMVDRPAEIVLYAGRLGASHEGVAVRRGETVQLAITRLLRTSYRCDVRAPSGSMTFTPEGYAHKLTMRPLEEAVVRHGIALVTVGEAARIARTVTA